VVGRPVADLLPMGSGKRSIRRDRMWRVTSKPVVFVIMLYRNVFHPLRPRLTLIRCGPIHGIQSGCAQLQSLASVTAFIFQLKEFGMLTARIDRNPSAATRRFVMRVGVMAGAVSVIAAGFGAGSASASPYMSLNRVGSGATAQSAVWARTC
jgi:hypothetical protein